MDKVLVLNSDYSPMNVTSIKRGFKLVFKGKAEIVKSYDLPLQSEGVVFDRPCVIRLLKYVKYGVNKIRVSRARIYRRDGYECVYCGSKRRLTIDHVIPRSRGGDNSWKNLVTCCHPCNLYKADRTPQEVGLTMIRQPYEPNIFSDLISGSVETIWNEFKSEMFHQK
jgi:5-methylcytosine-specific restriction endonuclease McrA